MNALLQKIVKTDVRVILVIGLFVLAGYSFMLGSPFKVMDDDFSIVRNVEIRDLKQIPHFFQSAYFKTDNGYYRPLVYVTYALEYHFFQLNYFNYNLDNVLLHFLNAILAFYLGLLLLHNRKWAFFAAFVFAIHPVHWEAVANTSGRSIILCASFVLGGLIAFLRFVREHKRRYLIMAVLFYVLALLSKESGGMLLFVAAGCLFLIEKRPWKEAGSLFPFVVIAFGYVFVRHLLNISTLMPWPTLRDMALGVISFLNGLFTYARLFFFPVDLRLDRAHAMFKGFGDPGVAMTLIVILLVAFLLFRFRQKVSGLVWFCLLWIALELFPVSQVVTTIGVYPGAISLAEHFLYVASVPVFILIIIGIDRGIRVLAERQIASKQVSSFLLVGFTAFLFLILCQQSMIASHEFLMVRSALQIDPGNARQHYSMGLLYVKAKDHPMILDCFKKAVKIDPADPKFRVALGMAFADNNDLLSAVQQYEIAKPETQELKDLLRDNRKILYERLRSAEATAQIEKANPEELFLLGIFYFREGDLELAAEMFDRFLIEVPDHARGHFNLRMTCQAARSVGKDFAVCQRIENMEPAMQKQVQAIQDAMGAWHSEQANKNNALR